MPSRRRTALLALGSAVAAIAMLGAPAVALGAPVRSYTARVPTGPGTRTSRSPATAAPMSLHYDLDLDYTPAAPDPAPLEGRLDGVATIDLVADAGSQPVQPRPARPHRHGGDGGRQARDLHADRRTSSSSRRRRRSRPARRPRSSSPTAARRPGRPTSRVRCTAGSPPATARWSSASPTDRPRGSPSNDHPTDKATYTFEITVPEGLVAVANGLPSGPAVTADGRTTWNWDAPDPMAAYLATASVGDYVVEPVHRRERHADLRCGRPGAPRSTVGGPRADERHARLLRGPVRAVPVQLLRRDRRRRLGRLRARDADPVVLLAATLARARSPTSSRTSGWATT